MSTLSDWNCRQIRLFQRYCRINQVPLSPELVTQLGARYAEKHAAGADRATDAADELVTAG